MRPALPLQLQKPLDRLWLPLPPSWRDASNGISHPLRLLEKSRLHWFLQSFGPLSNLLQPIRRHMLKKGLALIVGNGRLSVLKVASSEHILPQPLQSDEISAS